MNKIVSVTNSITSGKEAILEEAMAGVNVSCCFLSGPTMNVSVLEITSLQTAMKLSDNLYKRTMSLPPNGGPKF